MEGVFNNHCIVFLIFYVVKCFTIIGSRAASGVDLKTIAKLCRGDCRNMKIDTVCRIAAVLGVAPADLVPLLARRPRARIRTHG